jgi:hypothetical protein
MAKRPKILMICRANSVPINCVKLVTDVATLVS